MAQAESHTNFKSLYRVGGAAALLAAFLSNRYHRTDGTVLGKNRVDRHTGSPWKQRTTTLRAFSPT
jgi:hypothetical protein